MKKQKREKLRVGDRVRLKLGRSNRGGCRKIGIVERFLDGGGVMVTEPLDGYFAYWHITDLEKVRGEGL